MNDTTQNDAPQPPLPSLLEAILLTAGQPISLDRLCTLCRHDEQPIATDTMRQALETLKQDCHHRSYELLQVASGFKLQIRPAYSPWVGRLDEVPAPRYSRALLETLALIIYRQPVTRGEIEAIRGVAVSSHIIRTLIDRHWVRIVGHKDTPGHPALYATTAQLLDYFNLTRLDQFPPLADVRNLDTIAEALEAQWEPSLDEHPQEATTLAPGQGMKQQAEAATTELLASLDTLEEKLPKNFNDLLKGHFEVMNEGADDAIDNEKNSDENEAESP